MSSFMKDETGMSSDDEEVTETAEQWKKKGNDLYTEKKYTAAVDAYSRAIELDRGNALLYNNRAAAYLMLLQYKEALSDTERAISLDNTLSRAYFRKATSLKGLGNLEGALVAIEQGLVHDPSSKAALQDKTTLMNAKNKITEARNLMQQNQINAALIRLDSVLKEVSSTLREVNLMKVECLIKLKRLEEALNLTNSMMKTAQNGDVDLLRLRATCLFNMGDIDNALKHLQQAVRSDPDNTTVRTQYRSVKEIDEKKKAGDEAFKTGRNEEAITQWTHCIDQSSDSPVFASKVHLNRGIALAKLKKHDQAIKDFTKAIYYNSEYVKAYLKRADSYLAQGGPEKIQLAIDDLEKAGEIEQDEASVKEIKMKIKKAKVSLKRSKRKDLYSILGVGQDASEQEIKSAYRKAALKYHPDRHTNKSDAEKAEAEAMFKNIGEAYEILSNPEKKARYDSGVELEDMDNPHAGGFGGGFGYGGGYDDDDDDDYGHGHSHGGFGGGHRGGHGRGGGGAGGIDPNLLFHMFMQQQQQGGGGGFGGF